MDMKSWSFSFSFSFSFIYALFLFSKDYLRQVLERIAERETKGEHRNTYHLKREFRHYEWKKEDSDMPIKEKTRRMNTGL